MYICPYFLYNFKMQCVSLWVYIFFIFAVAISQCMYECPFILNYAVTICLEKMFEINVIALFWCNIIASSTFIQFQATFNAILHQHSFTQIVENAFEKFFFYVMPQNIDRILRIVLLMMNHILHGNFFHCLFICYFLVFFFENLLILNENSYRLSSVV